MNPFKFFSPSHLLEITPGSAFPLAPYFLGFCILVFVASFFLKGSSLAARLRELALIGLLWGFFRWQNVPYLSMRLWLVLIALIYFFHTVWVLWAPKEEKQVKVKVARDPYLPKAKKKSAKKR